MAKRRMYKVGLLVERSRAFGRELCEGVITFAQEREDWELHFMQAFKAGKGMSPSAWRQRLANSTLA